MFAGGGDEERVVGGGARSTQPLPTASRRKPDLRRMLGRWGPVAVFGASNFHLGGAFRWPVATPPRAGRGLPGRGQGTPGAPRGLPKWSPVRSCSSARGGRAVGRVSMVQAARPEVQPGDGAQPTDKAVELRSLGSAGPVRCGPRHAGDNSGLTRRWGALNPSSCCWRILARGNRSRGAEKLGDDRRRPGMHQSPG